jgi:hypothetical protein
VYLVAFFLVGEEDLIALLIMYFCILFEQNAIKLFVEELQTDRLCGLVVRVLGYRSGGPGSIPGTTRKKK